MSAPAARLPLLDLLRGIAVAMMFAYHFCFDLANFGFLQQNLYVDARWIAWRSLILSSFLLLAGASLSLAWRSARPWPGFRRRWLQIAACALLVSVGSYLMFPASWIWFGVLHHLALASLLALPLIRRPRLALLAGIAIVALGTLVQHRFFDQQPWPLVGLMTFKPPTEDYVPLLPWFGVLSIGIWVGHALAVWRSLRAARAWLPASGLARGLAFAGRHSLVLYLVHQPLFIGLLLAATHH